MSRSSIFFFLVLFPARVLLAWSYSNLNQPALESMNQEVFFGRDEVPLSIFQFLEEYQITHKWDQRGLMSGCCFTVVTAASHRR